MSDIEPQSVSEISLEGVGFDEPASTEPDLTVPAPESTPAPEGVAPEGAEATAPAEDDPYAEWGGRDSVQAAMRLYETASSEEGVIQIWIEAGRSLGLTVEQMQQLFGDGATATPEAEPEDLDAPLTKAEWLEYQRTQQEQSQRAAWEQQQAQTRVQASQALHGTIQELGLSLEDPATQHVLALGDRYLDKRNLSPESVRESVRRGYADYQAEIQRATQAYIQEKKGTRVPGAPSGASAPSTPAPDEPKDVAEAIRRFRDQFGS